MLAIRGGEKVAREEFPPWPMVDDEDRQALLAALDSGVWGVGGSRQEAFQKAWADFTGSQFTILTSSGSTALMSALRGCEIGAGDEVIVPAYTFQATFTSLFLTNAVPVVVDVDPGTLCMDPAAAAAAMTPRTRALLPVHVAGCPCDMGPLKALAESRSLLLIEDACQAHGAAWNGRPVGSLGAAGAFSFQSTKNLPAGEGGAITTSDPAVAALAAGVRNCGIPGRGMSMLPAVATNYRMTEFQAALLLSQMRKLPTQIRLREENAAILNRELASIPGITPLPRPAYVTTHAYHLYIFRYDRAAYGGASRESFLRALRAEGVPCHGGYPPFSQASFLADALRGSARGWRYFSDRSYERLTFPVSDAASGEVVWMTQRLLLGSPQQTASIVDAVRKVYEHRDELAA